MDSQRCVRTYRDGAVAEVGLRDWLGLSPATTQLSARFGQFKPDFDMEEAAKYLMRHALHSIEPWRAGAPWGSRGQAMGGLSPPRRARLQAFLALRRLAKDFPHSTYALTVSATAVAEIVLWNDNEQLAYTGA